MLVEIKDEIVRDDRIAGREERDETIDHVTLRPGHLVPQIHDIGREVDFLNGPRIFDRIFIHFIKIRVLHRAKREIESWV